MSILFCPVGTNAPELFEINEVTGVISIKNVIDREELLDIDAVVILKIKVSLLTNEFNCTVIILTYVVTIISYKFHEHYLICVLFFS